MPGRAVPASPAPTRRQALHRVVIALVPVVSLAVPAAGLAQADADAAFARRVFAEVNQALPRMQQAAFTARRPGVEYTSHGKAWSQSGAVRKIEIVEHDDSGDVVSEFYYADGALVFVYEAVKGFRGSSGQQVAVNEERLYFRDGRLVKWLSGMGNDKTDHPAGGASFAEASKSRLAASAAFLAAARKARTPVR